MPIINKNEAQIAIIKNQHCDFIFLFHARKAKKQIDIIVIIINNNYLCTQEIEEKRQQILFTNYICHHEKRRKGLPQEGRKARL